MADIDNAHAIYKEIPDGQKVTLVLTEKDVTTTNWKQCNITHVRYTHAFFKLADVVVFRSPNRKRDIVLKNRQFNFYTDIYHCNVSDRL